MSSTQRAFVLGLDGIPWSSIERWASDGTLPNFAQVLAEGTAGPLRSTIPAATPLAWPSIATGCSPDKHGIYGFQEITPDYTHRLKTSSDLDTTPLWQIVDSSVVVNIPMTYPAPEIDGTMIASVMAPELDEEYTHPSSLAAEIRDEIPEYEIALKWKEYVDSPDALLDDITTQIAARRQLLKKLMDEDDWELFFFAFMEPDRLQHLVWDEAVLRDLYRQLDEILGEILAYVERRDANLFIVSDHGFGPISKTVGGNRVLEEAGYLSQDESTQSRKLLDRVGLDKDTVLSTVDRLGFDSQTLLRKHLPRSMVDFLASQIPGNNKLYDLNHAETKAFLHEFGCLYINDTDRFSQGPVDPADVPAMKRDLTQLFTDLTDPDTGEQALDVYDGDELFPTDPRSPDLVIEPRDEYEISSSLERDVFNTPPANAAHRPDGIFLSWGPDIADGRLSSEPTVVDVAPTVLHSLGRPVPATADGGVLDEIFTSDSLPGELSVRSATYDTDGSTSQTDRDMDEVKERLQGLGYLE